MEAVVLTIGRPTIISQPDIPRVYVLLKFRNRKGLGEYHLKALWQGKTLVDMAALSILRYASKTNIGKQIEQERKENEGDGGGQGGNGKQQEECDGEQSGSDRTGGTRDDGDTTKHGSGGVAGDVGNVTRKALLIHNWNQPDRTPYWKSVVLGQDLGSVSY